MNFGSVPHPGLIDFTLPKDHADTARVLGRTEREEIAEVYIGASQWSRQVLKGFYPPRTKDELGYYARQFNAIELNATYYNNYGPGQIAKWTARVPDHFRFFPKVYNVISHQKRLVNVETDVEEYCNNVRYFGKHLGMCFLQLHERFGPAHYDQLDEFLQLWHQDIPLAVELRDASWFSGPAAARLYDLLEHHDVALVLTDTAGRRDLLHMRLTTPVAFIRSVGANHPTDYERLTAWAGRIKAWKEQGLKRLYFFVHQNEEVETPQLAAHFIDELNRALGTRLSKPNIGSGQLGLSF